MAEDRQQRTEPATTRRREEVRRRGQVTRSVEVNSAVILLAILLIFRVFSGYFFSQLFLFTKWIYENLFLFKFNFNNYLTYSFIIAMFLARILLPIFASALILGLVVNFIQVGFQFSIFPLTPNFEKINPLAGFTRIFSLRSSIELLKALLKIFIVSYIGYYTIKENLIDILKMGDMNIKQAGLLVAVLSYKIALRIAIILLFLALADYFYQRFEFEKSIRMTKQEIKDEYKQLEGDPHLRSRIRQRQREIARRRMMQEVEKADVIITNPIHIAVAIKYDKEISPAPIVIAKGLRLIAEKIKDVARNFDIPIVENPPLAQTLFKSCEIGQQIPVELYQAVAEVLAFVYTINKKRKTA